MPAVEIRGAQIYFEERGTGSAVVCVHGTGTYSAIWSPSTGSIATTHRVIAYDRRGYGASKGPLAASMNDHVSDLADFLPAINAAPAILVGQSGAGVVVLALAARHPELVRSIVLAEPANQLALFPSIGTSAAIGAVAYRALLLRDPEQAAEGFYRWASDIKSGGNGYDPMPNEWKSVARGHARAVMREIVQLTVPTPRARNLRSIAQPVTIVTTDQGQPVFRRTTRRVHRLLPNSRLVEIPGAGHLISTDKPAEFEAVLKQAVEEP